LGPGPAEVKRARNVFSTRGPVAAFLDATKRQA
jgi:hypothetical protein